MLNVFLVRSYREMYMTLSCFIDLDIKMSIEIVALTLLNEFSQ